MEASEKASVASGRYQEEFTLCDLLCDVRDEKKKTKAMVPK